MTIAGTSIFVPLQASAATTSFALDQLYNGTSPGPTVPWLSANFTDIAANTVKLTMTVNNLSLGEYVDTWYFNLATSMNASSLNIVKTNGGSGTVTASVVKGNNTLTSGGAGNFDFGFDFNNSGSGKLSSGDSVVYVITGIAGLSAASFNYVSSGGSYYTAASIKGISFIQYCGTATGKVGDNTNSSPAPEPATMAILGSFVALGAFLKKRADKSANLKS